MVPAKDLPLPWRNTIRTTCGLDDGARIRVPRRPLAGAAMKAVLRKDRRRLALAALLIAALPALGLLMALAFLALGFLAAASVGP